MDIKGNPETHTITITVHDDGRITYVNPLIWVDRGDTIVWECENSCPFTIHIGWNSPLEKGRFHSVKGESIKTVVPDTAQAGNYSYIVAAYDKKTGKIWTDDPPFIVKPPRG